METLVATCGYPGSYYLNIYYRSMSLINIDLSEMSLALNVGEDEWLITEIISGAMSMKAFRDEINEYDLKISKAIEDL